MATLDKGYDPSNIEKYWYEEWKNKGYFSPKGEGEPFVIVIPPPNITGKLHMGHALNLTLQDIPVRYNRMKGRDVLWLPGEDHAGIATQNVIEKELKKKGSSKDEIGREEFERITWEWANEYRSHIKEQIECIGCSVDWDRDKFTLDETLNKAVKKVFKSLFDKGLIYKGKYIVNWCPRCETVLSDEEVDHVDEKSFLWHFRYPVKDSGEFLTIATTRPETMLGDTAVAVHPSDERYSHLVGKTLILPIVNREIKIIADRYVDPSFGTGAVKVTPAHDPNDYQMGVRHELPFVEVMNGKGFMNENAGEYEGMTSKAARQAIVEKMEELGFLVLIEDYSHSVGHCSRCDTTIDPRLSDQWFVSMKPLAEKAIEAVEQDKVSFHPLRWKKVYLNWMNEIRDWCISRQLWWGHRIPVWYCRDCNHVNVSEDIPTVCEKCGSENLKQDEDVLDTWFSSGLWPFSTLGWPDDTDDLKKYYPTSVLTTGFDIIFFWVARMITMGMEFMNEVPFRDVYINQLIRDKKGRKMSKSLGNGIDPIEVVKEYGADAMRFTLATLAGQGRDINLDVKYIDNFKRFANKIWNASRFALMNLEGFSPDDNIDSEALTLADRWILTRLANVIEGTASSIDNFDYNIAAKSIYEFFWNEFCDWYIESVKPTLYSDSDPAVRTNTQKVLVYILDNSLRLLHPFMPFITEEIWQKLPLENAKSSIMISEWPVAKPELIFPEHSEKYQRIMNQIRGIRNIRAEFNIPHSKKFHIAYKLGENQLKLEEVEEEYVKFLSGSESVVYCDSKPEKSATAFVSTDFEVFVILGDMINWNEEAIRLEKELKKMEKDVEHFEKKLSNCKFMENADEIVIEETKEKYGVAKDNFLRVKKLLEDFGN